MNQKSTTKQTATGTPALEAGAAESREQIMERKRADARRRAQQKEEARKEELRRTVTARGKLRGRPVIVHANWEPSPQDVIGFDRTYRVTEALKQLEDKIHPDDRSLVFNCLGASMSFREFSDIVDALSYGEPDELCIEDIASDLRNVRIGFELALQALDNALRSRGVVLDGYSRGGSKKAVPEWHRACIELARNLLATGTDKRTLIGKLVPRIKRDRTSIARVLRKAGIK